jgi:hypothetical protein
MAALNVAINSRRPPGGYVHHSDRGLQPRLKWSSQRWWQDEMSSGGSGRQSRQIPRCVSSAKVSQCAFLGGLSSSAFRILLRPSGSRLDSSDSLANGRWMLVRVKGSGRSFRPR